MTHVPKPNTLGLFGVGAIGLFLFYRRLDWRQSPHVCPGLAAAIAALACVNRQVARGDFAKETVPALVR